MTGYILSPAAEIDLISIWLYTAETWNVEQADRYTFEIKAACTAVASGLRTGRAIDEVKAGYKKLGVGVHFVVYRVAGDSIDVVRILHQRMDIHSRLQN